MEKHGADGPADLRRRRLRQDRDRGARGVQGDPGRQAGRRPRADHAARQQHRHTFAERYAQFPVKVAVAVPLPDRQGGQGGARRAWPTAASTSSSAPTACSPRRCGSRTSAWSSSTRSSASASSTRSSSRRCAPRSTCWRCRPRRSRARSRWRSPASARCRRSQRRPRSATRCSPSSAPTTRSRSPRRSGASCCARARSSSCTTRCATHREGRGPHARARARGPHRDGARPDGRAPARAGRARLLGEAVRRARLHHDRRDRARHLQRQHPHRRARRPCSACRSCTSCAVGSAVAASGPTPTSSTRPRSR